MKKHFIVGMLCFVVIFSLLLGGCNSSAPATPSEPSESSESTESTSDKKVLRIGVSADITGLDPHAHGHTPTDSMFRNIGSRLFRRANNMEIVTDLATSYEIIDDTTWKVTIHDNAFFTNGDQVTSADVKYTLERVSTDTSLLEYNYLKDIAGVEIIDDYNMYIKTKGPKPDMLTLLAKSGSDILPAAYIEENGMEGFMKEPVLSGQYILKEWVPDSHYTLVANENYYGEPAYWDEVIYKVIPESSTRVAELLTGGVDIIDNIPPNEWERIESDDSINIVKGETARVLLLNVRLTDGYVTSDPLVREAIECAIDKNMICDELLKGAGVPTRTRVGNGVVGFNNDLFGREKGDLYDPEKAKELLKQAGYENGVKLHLTGSKGRYLMDGEICEMIASMLTSVGFDVELEIVEPSVLSSLWNAHENEELFQIGLGDNQYDAAYPLIHYGDKKRVEGLTDYDSKECQALYEKALYNMDLEERAKQMEEIQAIAAEDRPHICIAQLSSVYGVNENLIFEPRLDECYELNTITLK